MDNMSYLFLQFCETRPTNLPAASSKRNNEPMIPSQLGCDCILAKRHSTHKDRSKQQKREDLCELLGRGC